MWMYLLEKEFKQFFRDPGLPKILIAFPLMMMLVFPFAVSMEIKNINLVVVDNSKTSTSCRLINKCIKSGYFRLVEDNPTTERARQLLDLNKADAILTIDSDFEKQFESGMGLPLGIKVNTINGSKGSIGAGYLSNCIRDFVSSEKDGDISSVMSKNINVLTRYYYNEYMDYKVFMVPALIVIAITMITGFFPALNIVNEKEKGTIEQINVTPIRKTTFILCKLIPYWIVAFFILSSCLVIAWLVFGYTCAGSLSTLFVFTALHIMVTAGLGLLISNYSDNAQQAMFITWFFMIVFMLISGIFTPISSMPVWAQMITYLNPLRYYADAMRFIFLKGSSFFDIWYDALGLFVIGVTMLSWAVLSYKKQTA